MILVNYRYNNDTETRTIDSTMGFNLNGINLVFVIPRGTSTDLHKVQDQSWSFSGPCRAFNTDLMIFKYP